MTTIENRDKPEPVQDGQEKKQERRRSRRFPCAGSAEVAVFNAGFLFRGEIRDISGSGCYVQTRARLRLHRDDEVELHFTLGSLQIRCLARVKSLRPGQGAGFEFAGLEDRVARSIQQHILQVEKAEQTTQEKAKTT